MQNQHGCHSVISGKVVVNGVKCLLRTACILALLFLCFQAFRWNFVIFTGQLVKLPVCDAHKEATMMDASQRPLSTIYQNDSSGSSSGDPHHRKGRADHSRFTTFHKVADTHIYVYNDSALYTRSLHRGYAVLVLGVWYQKGRLHNVDCILKGDTDDIEKVQADVRTTEVQSIHLVYAYIPIMIWCHAKFVKKPLYVSIVKGSPQTTVEKPKDSESLGYEETEYETKVLPVHYPRHFNKSGKVAVCYKHMYNYVPHQSLIEVLELQRLQGADKVILYGYTNVSSAVAKVIKYYERSNFLLIRPWKHHWIHGEFNKSSTYAGFYEQGQHLLYNDCVHRYASRFEYLAFLDLDEFIIPAFQNIPGSYQSLINHIQGVNNITSEEDARHVCQYQFAWSKFCVAKALSMHSNYKYFTQEVTQRTAQVANIKSLVRAENVYKMDTHWAQLCFNESKAILVSPYIAKTHHYRFASGFFNQQPCKIKDPAALRYGLTLKKAVDKIVKLLNL